MDILPHLCNTGFLEMQRQIDPQGSLFIHSSFLMRQFEAYVYDNLWMIVMFSGHNLQSHTLTQYTHMYITLNSHIKTKWSKYSSLIVSVSQTQNHIILKPQHLLQAFEDKSSEMSILIHFYKVNITS